ncbi:glycoprotein-N-acetylgalactosamine 3-beta-galactosyltransferase 1-like [Panulirus ornatus]|uniref:glycoprotein-N-acetylgalactosamine 3-beta-galactosyltransferase 1-like n=1 Tax=Panulirus ornatus TaxID=150431 RepID=UPI003A85AAE6
MGRRTVALAMFRTISTFCLGFGLGVVLHLFVNMTVNLSNPNDVMDTRRTDFKVQARVWPEWTGEEEEEEEEERRSSWPVTSYQDLQHPLPLTGAPRILCYVLTGPTTHHTTRHVRDTWGQRCDRILFFSTQEDEDLRPQVVDVPEGYGYLWAKTKAALTHLHHHYPHYHWYLKADDDTFVIVENLRYFLRNLDPDDPVYYGVKFRQHVKQGYMSGGGGYVLSREALRRFVTQALRLQDQGSCPTRTSTGAEDLHLGRCLESVGVKAGDSLDEIGKPRFFSHNPMSLFYKLPLINRLHWYWSYIWHKHGVGPDCCSRHLISFHKVDPRMMWTLETLLYRIHIHRDLQPPHLNTSTSPVTPSPASSSTPYPASRPSPPPE